MSGFDTSQPIADEKSLKDVETDPKPVEEGSNGDAEPADADELGDATPGPR